MRDRAKHGAPPPVLRDLEPGTKDCSRFVSKLYIDHREKDSLLVQACIFFALLTHVLLTIGLVYLDGTFLNHEISVMRFTSSFFTTHLCTGAASHIYWYLITSRTDLSQFPRKVSSFCEGALCLWFGALKRLWGRAWEQIVYKSSWGKHCSVLLPGD